MDPLSISMAILATISAIKSTINVAKSIYDAPEELDQLWNDLTEGELMVLDVKHHLGQPRTEILSEANLQERLREAETVLLELKILVQTVVSTPQDPTRAKRIRWFRTKKRTVKLRAQLAQIHQDLPRLLGQVETSRIKLELKNVSVIQQQIHTAQQGHSEVFRSSHQLQQRVDSSVEQLRRDVLARLERIESALPTSNDSRAVSEISALSTVGKRQLINYGLMRTGPANQSLPSKTEANASVLQSTYGTLRVQTQYRRPSSYQSACHCPCRCHVKHTITTPSSLGCFIGQLFVGYKGMPMMSKSCNEEKCKRNLGTQPSIHAVYFFPRWWIIDRMMLLIARQRDNLGPELILRFPTCIHWESAAAILVNQGKIESVQRQFASGMASPNDLMVQDGSAFMICLLRSALRCKQFPMMKYLVHAGAALDMEDISGDSVADEACRVLLKGDVPEEHQQWAKDVFLSSRLQDLEFSCLHESILGMRRTTVSEECSQLLSLGSSIDLQDLWGNTPLYWASTRGNKEAIVQLLEFGANPNVANKRNQGPLYGALVSGHLECAMTLLSHGADATFTTDYGWGAIQTAVTHCGAHPSITLLLDKLYGLGCELNTISSQGYSSLSNGLEYNHHNAIRWLLTHGEDYRNTVPDGNILHMIGLFADLQTVKIFREARLTGIDVHAKSYGGTVMDGMLDPERNPPASDELIASFTRLLHEIEARTNGRAPFSYADEKDSVAEPESNSLFSEVKSNQTVEQISDPFSDDLEDEEQYFMDSLEVQTEGSDEEDIFS